MSEAGWLCVRRISLAVIVISLLVPAHTEVAGIRLTPSLVALMAAFPFLVFAFFAQRLRIRAPDVLFLAFVGWQALTIAMNNPARFVEFSGQQTLMTVGGYLVGRTAIRSADDFAFLVWLGAALVIASLPFALYEALTDDPIILLWIMEHTGFDTFIPNDYEARLGLHRAQWVFTHPIHYGLMGAFFLSLLGIGMAARHGWALRLAGGALVFGACILSVSSGAILSALMQAGIFIWYRLSGLFGPPWRVLLVGGALLYTAIELSSTKSAFVAVSGRLAINSQTAHYRTLIWEYGSAQVARTPIFGNGYNYWPRPHWMVSSVDNYWLQQAMVHGLPAVACLGGAYLFSIVAINRVARPTHPEMRLGWTLFLAGFALSASTVAIWGEIQTLFMILFGAGLWMLPDVAKRVPGPASLSRGTPPCLTRFPNGPRGAAA